jgi:hypothetical protein
MGLERGPLSLVSTIESADHATPLKLTQTSSTSGGRSVGIVRSRAKATEFVF